MSLYRGVALGLAAIAILAVSTMSATAADSTQASSGLGHPGFRSSGGFQLGAHMGAPSSVDQSICNNLPSYQRPSGPLTIANLAVNSDSRLIANYERAQTTSGGGFNYCEGGTSSTTINVWSATFDGTSWSSCTHRQTSSSTWLPGSYNCSE